MALSARYLVTAPTRAGSSFPPRVTVASDGVSFSLFSKKSAVVVLLLFDHTYADNPARVISLDPGKNKTYHYRHDAVRL